MRLRGLPLTTVNILCVQETFHELPSTFCVVGRSVNFRHLSVQLRDLWLTSVNILHGRETFGQLLSNFRAAG